MKIELFDMVMAMVMIALTYVLLVIVTRKRDPIGKGTAAIKPNPGEYFLFGDIETGGLNGKLECGGLGMARYPIFELAFVLTDSNLNQVGDPLRIVVWQLEERIAMSDPWALDVHGKSGLLDEVRNSTVSLFEAEEQVLAWLDANGVESYNRKERTGAIFCGNSIMFDRDFIMCQMPELHNYLHYRQLDISAIALAARAWAPELANQAVEHKQYKHEAFADIQESIDELKCYRAELFGGFSE